MNIFTSFLRRVLLGFGVIVAGMVLFACSSRETGSENSADVELLLFPGWDVPETLPKDFHDDWYDCVEDAQIENDVLSMEVFEKSGQKVKDDFIEDYVSCDSTLFVIRPHLEQAGLLTRDDVDLIIPDSVEIPDVDDDSLSKWTDCVKINQIRTGAVDSESVLDEVTVTLLRLSIRECDRLIGL